jgi:hypothetical protein
MKPPMKPPMKPIETRVAHTGADELRLHGYRVFAQLLGRTTTAQALILGMTGVLLDGDDVLVIDDIVTAMSSADPRLWPFKVTRVASAYGSAATGLAATLLAGEGGMYGSNRLAAAASWLVDLAERGALSDAELVAAIRESGGGFGVLYRARDERLIALSAQVVKRQRQSRRYWSLCDRAVTLARAQLELEAHVYLALAALCLDLGFRRESVAGLGFVLLFHDALANAIEGAEQAPDILRELPWSEIADRSPPARTSPRFGGSRPR